MASDLAHVLWMGGSPCSGKSSIAKQIAQWAQALDLKVLTVDGKRTIEQNAKIVAQHLGLE